MFSRLILCMLLGLLALIASGGPSSALTVKQPITPDYLKAHAKEWSLKVEKRENGMLHFTVGRTLTQVKYLVSRVVLKQDGKTLADITTPTFAQKGENRFHVAVSPAQLAEAEYELSESFVSGSKADPVYLPIPGSFIYKFSLKDFVK